MVEATHKRGRRHLLEGVDGRTAGAVRFKRLINSFSADLGGIAALTEAERALVRQAASLTMRAEQLQAAIARNEPVNPDEVIRLSSEARRTLQAIRRRAPVKRLALQEYLARRGDVA